MTELRTWWSSLQLQDPQEETPLPRSLCLADIQCGSYFDLTCQVCKTNIEVRYSKSNILENKKAE